MTDSQEIKIACNKSIKDWNDLESKLRSDMSNVELWEKAFSFFEGRMMSRYFNPMQSIKANDTRTGEGFSMVAILCSMIEMLESFYQGKAYRKPTTEHPLDDATEYYRSQPLFENFLIKREPFKSQFSRKCLAVEFYENVRCAILHEAATRKGWCVRTDTEALITEKEGGIIVLNRDIFIEYIKTYIKEYKKELFRDSDLKTKFIQKMNFICEYS